MRRITVLATLMAALLFAGRVPAADRPNIVWIVAEDMSPDLGCYGSPVAVTPNLDRFAGQGARFTRCFTHAPVCAPSRSGLITGRYPTSIGSHHMRSKLRQPPELFTQTLRAAGYQVIWPGKTDFNFSAIPKGAFDSTANWLKDGLPDGPFFAYVNFTVSHESQIRAPEEQYRKNTTRLTAEQRHDPAKMPVPPYYPDTPEVRKDIARYHDNVSAVDHLVGDVLAELDRRKLTDNTVVFFFGDHGWGMPRGKRWVYDSGTRCPLLVRWPGHIKPGSVRDDLVAFVDFAPTVLVLAGAKPEQKLDGRPFLGDSVKPREFAFSARDRMDEAEDRIRSVRDSRFRYVRNYRPELPYAQHIEYMNLMPTMQVWRRLAKEGKLEGPAKAFFAAEKPKEELYDTATDPHEVKNLAGDPAHTERLKTLRAALDAWEKETGDLGAVPEAKLVERGLVDDVSAEYEERRKRHPKD